MPTTIGAPLTSAQIARFHCDGFIAVPALVAPDELAILREFYDRRILSGALVGKIVREEQPEIRDLAFRERAQALIAQLFPDAMGYHGEKYLYRSASERIGTPWHQDAAYCSPQWHPLAATLWIALQDVDERSGCLHHVAGSHRHGQILPHRFLYIEPGHGGHVDIEAIAGHVDLARARPCPLPAGGCVIHCAHTLHRASANAGADTRRAYILNFGGQSLRRPPQGDAAVPEQWPWLRDRAAYHRGRQEAGLTAARAEGDTAAIAASS